MNCWKIYFGGAFIGTRNTAESATAYIRSITAQLKKHLGGQWHAGYEQAQKELHASDAQLMLTASQLEEIRARNVELMGELERAKRDKEQQ